MAVPTRDRCRAGQVRCRKAKKVWPSGHRTSVTLDPFLSLLLPVVSTWAKKVWPSRHGTSPTFFAPQAGPPPVPGATEKARYYFLVGSFLQSKERNQRITKNSPNGGVFRLVWLYPWVRQHRLAAALRRRNMAVPTRDRRYFRKSQKLFSSSSPRSMAL